jgi:hypothetical protein
LAAYSFLHGLLTAAVLAGVLPGAAGAQPDPSEPPVTAPQPAPKTPLQRFHYAFFEDRDSARDGLDTRTLTQLEGADRAQAERMLIDFLPDARAVIGLGLLRSRKAEPKLARQFKAALREWRTAERHPDRYGDRLGLVYLAKSLWQIHPDPRWPAAIIKVLNGKESVQRKEAATALGIVGERAAARALIKALDDSEPLVRYHATRSLLAIYGLPPADITDAHDVAYQVMSNDAARHAEGKRTVLATIAGRKIATR